jgi:hypothetical protein
MKISQNFQVIITYTEEFEGMPVKLVFQTVAIMKR